MKMKRRNAVDQRGFLLLEVLIAMLIFSIGVLGIVGLQASMTRAQTGSKFRADASFLAQRLVGTMWSDAANINSYATANCSAYARCSQWATDVATLLPNGAVAVDVATPVVTISITWQPSNDEQRRYTTTLALAANSAVTP
jgi:type IV pilus assembly protein PilV